MSQSAETIARQLLRCFKQGNKLLCFGNGGSSQQASHFVAELIHEGLPAISLTSDASVLTATANDFSYKEVFARQIIALGKTGDIAMGFSTSGKSENVLYAYEWAKKMDLGIIDFPRKGKNTPRIQEYQLKLLHNIWEAIHDNKK